MIRPNSNTRGGIFRVIMLDKYMSQAKSSMLLDLVGQKASDVSEIIDHYTKPQDISVPAFTQLSLPGLMF
ncbi:MAG: hypothetical protein ACI909_000693 [Planctomycetota bacterium]|jgi:hypothetical protein